MTRDYDEPTSAEWSVLRDLSSLGRRLPRSCSGESGAADVGLLALGGLSAASDGA